jgi:leader peptidase (prepilin peptidase)/N-methyltransferase
MPRALYRTEMTEISVAAVFANLAAPPALAGQPAPTALASLPAPPTLASQTGPTAVLANLVALTTLASPLVAAAFMLFVLAAVALTAIDLREYRLPDKILLPTIASILVLFLLAAHVNEADAINLQRGLVGALLSTALHLALHLIARQALGFGDVKLAGLIGLVTGWIGFGVWATAAVSSFLLAGGAVLILLLRKTATRNTHIAFGPFMLLAANAALVGEVARAG